MILFGLVVFASTFASSILAPVAVQADSGISGLQNTLSSMKKNCQSIVQASNQWNTCQEYQNKLSALAGCSGNMFDSGGEGRGGTIYTLDQSNFNDCQSKVNNYLNVYDTAQGLLTSMANDCKSIVKNSNQWNTCQNSYQDPLTALGCSGNMFDSGGEARGGTVYTLDQSNFNACQNIVNGILSDAAAAACQGVGGSLIACEAGYIGQILGKSQNDACQGISDSSACAKGYGYAAAASAALSGGPVGGGPTAPTVTCDTSGNPLTWIICPIISGLQDLVSGLDTEIDSLLAVGTTGTSTDQPTKVFCPGAETGTCGDYYTAWGDFRDIALGLMVVAGLLIVIAQALGMEVLDAYTIRRALPRLLVAAIAITLSWPLMEFFVVLSNDLGYGISALISHPFSGVVGSFSLNGTNGLFTSLAGAVALGTLGVFGLLSFIGTAAIAVIIAFLVLVVRQLVIIMLVLIAPIAIVAYILPNTQRVYHLWRDIFTKTLLMFPMIAALIAVGRDFAAVALQAAPGSGTLSDFIQQIIALIAYFGPYFAIPLTFQFAGGIMSTVGNAVNSRGEGARNAIRGYRGNVAKKNLEKLKTGHRLNEDINTLGYNRFAERFNRATRGTANLKNAGFNPGRVRSRMQAGAAGRDLALAQEGLEKNPEAKTMTDDLYESMFTSMESRPGSGIHGGDSDAARRAFLADRGFQGRDLEEGVATTRAFARSMGNTQAAKVAAVIGNSRTGTGFQRNVGGAAAMNAAIIEAGGGSRWLMDQTLVAARTGMNQERRLDAAGGSFTRHEALLMRQARQGLQPDQVNEQLARNALEGQSGGAILSSRRQSQEALIPFKRTLLEQSFASGDNRRITQELATAAGFQDAASQVSPEAAKLNADEVLSHTVDIATLTPEQTTMFSGAINAPLPRGQIGPRNTITYQEAIESMRGDREFNEMRREYANRNIAEAAAANATAAGAGGGPGGPAGPAGGGP